MIGLGNSLIIQLLRSEKLKSYVAREMDSSELHVLLKYRKDLLLKNGLLYQKVLLKKPSRTHFTVSATEKFCSQGDFGLP